MLDWLRKVLKRPSADRVENAIHALDRNYTGAPSIFSDDKKSRSSEPKPAPVLHRAYPGIHTAPRAQRKREPKETDVANDMTNSSNPLSPLSPLWVGNASDKDTPTYGGGGSAVSDSSPVSDGGDGGGSSGGDISCDPALDHIRHRAFRI